MRIKTDLGVYNLLIAKTPNIEELGGLCARVHPGYSLAQVAHEYLKQGFLENWISFEQTGRFNKYTQILRKVEVKEKKELQKDLPTELQELALDQRIKREQKKGKIVNFVDLLDWCIMQIKNKTDHQL